VDAFGAELYEFRNEGIMSKAIRFSIFFALLIVLFGIGYLFNSTIIPSPDIENTWFYSGILMLLISTFFIEPYYSAPMNVTINSISLLLSLLSLKTLFTAKFDSWIWWSLFGYLALLFIASLFAIILRDTETSDDSFLNKSSKYLKKISVTLGSGRIVYSVLFIVFLLLYYSIQTYKTLLIMLFWAFIIIIEPYKLTIFRKEQTRANDVGKIIGVQSRKIFLSKLYNNRSAIAGVRLFDTVAFRYSMRDNPTTYFGLVIDRYLLNEEKWVKVLHVYETSAVNMKEKDNVLYKVSEIPNEEVNERIKRLVGIVIENSEISKIRFSFNSKLSKLEAGDIVEIKFGENAIYYQITNGITVKENLLDRNEIGFIRTEATQLGIWNSEEMIFEKYGWVPEINTPVYLSTTQATEKKIELPEYCIGKIPNIGIPAIIDLDTAIDHHIGILGITGSGKSFISIDIINNLIKLRKVICIDFTGEYSRKLTTGNPVRLLGDVEKLKDVEDMIAKYESSKSDKNKVDALNYKRKIVERITDHIREFYESTETNLGIFELPDLSNTTFILEFTSLFFDALFKYKKTVEGKLCLVIEEAHTIIPETNMLGDLGDYSSNKAVVNKIGQIALQGRKYGIGFIVIAQRTANVSKTILTQCNSLICFQAFDNTSFEFQKNYLDEEYIKAIPNMKRYHAVLVGKAFRSNIPMIVDLTREIEKRST